MSPTKATDIVDSPNLDVETPGNVHEVTTGRPVLEIGKKVGEPHIL